MSKFWMNHWVDYVNGRKAEPDELARLRAENARLRAELEAAKADTARLDKVEGMNIDTDIAVGGPKKWIALDQFGRLLARGTNIRECIDGVPE